MIKRLRLRFIRITMVTLTVAMVLVVGVVDLANWISVRQELTDTLHLLVEAFRPTDEFPEMLPFGIQVEGNPDQTADAESNPETSSETNPETNPESAEEVQNLPRPDWSAMPKLPSRHFRNMLEESSWFSARVTEDGEVKRLRIDQQGNIDTETARALILQAAETGKEEGFLQDLLYHKKALQDGGSYVFVLNCETRLASVRKLVLISALACAGAILLSGLLVSLASRKAIQPTIRNMEQQKQFITNASHELKTPLTVISTNMELLQMELKDNPWVRATQKQTAVLRRLVDELVYLSRMEEEHPPLEMETLNPGTLLKETAESFIAMAEFHGMEMTVMAEDGLQMTGDRASIQRLISTLCDNAVKYASDGEILAEVHGEGKNIVLQVSNPVAEPLTREQCSQLFNRFYQADPSRKKGRQSGFGLGLSIAAAIAEKHGGKISAAMDGDRLQILCQLPKEMKQP